MPHKLKNGPLYSVIDVSCTIVTVIGYGNVLSTILPITLLLDDTIYHNKHNANTLKILFVLSVDMIHYIFFYFLRRKGNLILYQIYYYTKRKHYTPFTLVNRKFKTKYYSLDRNGKQTNENLGRRSKKNRIGFYLHVPRIWYLVPTTDDRMKYCVCDDKVKVNKYSTLDDSHGFYSFFPLLF